MKKLLLSLLAVSMSAALVADCCNTCPKKDCKKCDTCKTCKKEEKPCCPKPPKCERDKVVTTCEAPKKTTPCPVYECPAGTRTVKGE